MKQRQKPTYGERRRSAEQEEVQKEELLYRYRNPTKLGQLFLIVVFIYVQKKLIRFQH